MTRDRPTWLVTGGSGFLGARLLEHLGPEPVRVVTLGRREVPGFDHLPADLLNPDATRQALAGCPPDVVFHLAGQTPPADPDVLDRVNRVATANLLTALADLERPVRVVAVGSAAELGPVPTAELPVGEAYEARPDGAYGRSKLAATGIVLSAPAPIVPMVARVFNPIGSGLPESQALGRFAAYLKSGATSLTVGDLSPRRDFIDVGDVAMALISLACSGSRGLYHVGTGRSRSVADGLALLLELAGRTVDVIVDPSIPPGPPDSRADIGRLVRETGWRPGIPFEESVANLWAAAPGH